MLAGEFDAKASTFLDLETRLNSAKMTKPVISRSASSPANSAPNFQTMLATGFKK